jgi:anti-sigma factor RsiW
MREILDRCDGAARLMLFLRLPEGTLSGRDRRRFERHLRGCPNCSAYLEQIRATIRATGTIEADDLTPEARDDLTELYRRWRSE